MQAALDVALRSVEAGPRRRRCRPGSRSSRWAGSAAASWATPATPTCCSCTTRSRAPTSGTPSEAAHAVVRRAAPAARRCRRPTRRWSSTPTCGPRAGRARWCAPWRRTPPTTSAGRCVWESQALLRAEPVAGDAELGARFVALVDPLRYRDGGLDGGRRARDPADQGAGRGRAAAARRRPAPAHQARAGRPGRRRVDRAAAAAAARRASCRGCGPPAPCEALAAAAAGRAARRRSRPGCWRTPGGPRAGCATRSCWCAAARATRLPTDLRELTGVARGARLPSGRGGELVDDYRRATRRARTVVEQVFYR